MNTPTHYTLNEYTADRLEFTSLDVNGQPLIFDKIDDAVAMAQWMLEGGAEDGQLPLVSILGWDADPAPQFATDEYLDIAAYACGWVEARTTTNDEGDKTVRVFAHEGDYENDEGLWSRMPKRVVVA